MLLVIQALGAERDDDGKDADVNSEACGLDYENDDVDVDDCRRRRPDGRREDCREPRMSGRGNSPRVDESAWRHPLWEENNLATWPPPLSHTDCRNIYCLLVKGHCKIKSSYSLSEFNTVRLQIYFTANGTDSYIFYTMLRQICLTIISPFEIDRMISSDIRENYRPIKHHNTNVKKEEYG